MAEPAKYKKPNLRQILDEIDEEESTKVFTAEEVESLNAYQNYGLVHPFTCGGNRTDENHLDGEGILVATEQGWYCPYCSYTQTSAHPWMKDWSWKSKYGQFPDIMRFKE